MVAIAPQYSQRAREFLDKFIADLDRHTPGAIPQSQLVQRVSRVPFECDNAGSEAVHLIEYAGGTIASKPGRDGLTPSIVKSFDEMCVLHGINPKIIKKQFPNTTFAWSKIPPKPLDSGTMEEPERIRIVEFHGNQAQDTLKKYGRLDAQFLIHGTDTAPLSLSRLAEVYSCSSIPTVGCTAQDKPGTYGGDGPINICDGILLLHAAITGHFNLCQKQLFLPQDSLKINDRNHGIYGPGPYGYGHYGTMNAHELDIHKSTIKQRSASRRYMPRNNPDFIRHYKMVDGRYDKNYGNVEDGTCYVLDINAPGFQVAREIQRIRNGEAGYHYIIAGAHGSSNTSDIRKTFLLAAAEAGICSLVVSEVPGAKPDSPYASGVRSATHVNVVQPTAIFAHTLGMFYVAAAYTEYVMEVYKLSEKDKTEVRPLLFNEMYSRRRGYSDAFIPNAQDAKARIQDHALYLWQNAQSPSGLKPA